MTAFFQILPNLSFTIIILGVNPCEYLPYLYSGIDRLGPTRGSFGMHKLKLPHLCGPIRSHEVVEKKIVARWRPVRKLLEKMMGYIN
jgi:hypothetical protein